MTCQALLAVLALTVTPPQGSPAGPFLAPFPERARRLLRDGRETDPATVAARAQELARAVPDPSTLLLAICRGLGARAESWEERPPEVRIVAAAARSARAGAFTSAVDRVRAEPFALLGAARLFFREGLWEDVPARETPRLAALLGQAVLAGGRDDSKPIVLRGLGSLRGPETRMLLRDVVSGRTGLEADPEALGEEPGVRTGALVALGRHADSGVRGDALALLARPARPADKAAVEVTLALLGDVSRLTALPFQLRSFTLGLAAIEAVERDRRRQAFGLLVERGLSHPYPAVVEDGVEAVQRMTGLSFRAAEDSTLQERVAAVREWYGREGALFVSRQRSR